MTARERAQRICPIYKTTRNADHFAKCGECQRVEREILAAEREAVEAFAAYLAPKIDMPNAVRMHLEAWLRGRMGDSKC